MTATYDDAAVLYGAASLQYDGDAAPDLLLRIGGVDLVGYLKAKTLTARVPADGSQGTCDFALQDPPTIPEVDDTVRVGSGSLTTGYRLFHGRVRSVRVEEYLRADELSTYTVVHISCQDDGESRNLPVAAPFAISDTPAVGEAAYRSLTVTEDRIDADTTRRRATLVLQRSGIRPGMNVLVTSGNQEMVAEEWSVQQVGVSWPARELPEYTLELGAPLIRLAQVVRDIPDGGITETMIADDSISTPKLQANVVTSEKFVAGPTGRIPEGVELGVAQTRITNQGVQVLDNAEVTRVLMGALGNGDFGLRVVNGPGTVIIDGSSNMFKVAATGTLASGSVTNNNSTLVTTTLTGLGALPATPAILAFIGASSSATASRAAAHDFDGIALQRRFAALTSGGSPNQLFVAPTVHSFTTNGLDGSNQAVVSLYTANGSGSTITRFARFYVLVETAI